MRKWSTQDIPCLCYKLYKTGVLSRRESNGLPCKVRDVRQTRQCSVFNLSLFCPHLCWSVCRFPFTLHFIIPGFRKKKKEKKSTFIQPQPLLLIYHNLISPSHPPSIAKMKNAKLRRDFIICQHKIDPQIPWTVSSSSFPVLCLFVSSPKSSCLWPKKSISPRHLEGCLNS